MIDEWRKKDPIDRLEKVLLADHILTGESKKKMESDIAAGIDDAVVFAVESGYPSGENAGEGVYAP
jgi:TPP-dependent pyruvate/acetoin dehydrogenase alpha subunit